MSAWSQWDGPSDYIWVVICKNHEFHSKKNSFSGYKIPLGETDAFENPPALGGELKVRCDACGQENTYLPDDLVRLQMAVAANLAVFSSTLSIWGESRANAPLRASSSVSG